MARLKEDVFNVSLMFHGVIDACDDARVKYLGFEGSKLKMALQIWRLALELSCHVLM
jgi:hypothetical protein